MFLGGLGVHISFVRSVTMDKWKDIEIEKMRVGGNKKAREFLLNQESWDETDPIAKRYDSFGAVLYRDKITTLAQGKSWDIAEAKKRLEKQKSSSHNMSHSKSTGALPDYSQESSYHDSGSGYQNYNSPEVKDRRDNYFNKIQSENAQRPDNLVPSQGGKYAGFGNYDLFLSHYCHESGYLMV